MCNLLRYYIFKPTAWKDIAIIYRFRAIREILAEQGVCGDLENKQYELTAKQLGVPVKRVQACVNTWIMEYPLLLIKNHQFPYVREFCYALRRRSVQLAVYSDYPAQGKIKVLDLPKMLTTCSTDRDIDIFKPSPKGLLYTIEHLCVPAHSCLLIGDRDDRDGECARRAGIKYLLKVARKSEEHQFECYKTLLCDFHNTEWPSNIL